MNEPQQLVPINENKEVLQTAGELAKQYIRTPKYSAWEDYFFDKRNKETHGNATISACYAYGLDPDNPKAYRVAANIGHQNVKKCKNLRRRYWESQGLTEGKLLDLYNNLMIERKDVNMLYSIADDMGIELPEYKQIVAPKLASQQNTQINATDVQVNFTSLAKK